MQSIQGALPHCLEGRFTPIPTVLHDIVESPREFQLVSLLLSYRWYPTSPIIPSVETLRKQLGCSARTVRRTVAALEHRGLLRREYRHADDNRQMSNSFVLCGELLAAVTAVEASTGRGGGHERRPTLSAAAGKPNQRNQTNRNRRSERQLPIPQTSSAYLETRGGRLRPR